MSTVTDLSVLTDTGANGATDRVRQALAAHGPVWRLARGQGCTAEVMSEAALDEHVIAEVTHVSRADVAALLNEVAARAWTQGHRTSRVPDPAADCPCWAYNENECLCGEFGRTIDAPNPYQPALTQESM